MNLSKGLFVVLLVSVVGMLFSVAALAAPPTLSVSGIPANVVAGSMFKVSVVSSNTTAGQTVNTMALVNSLNWPTSPATSQTCGAGSMSCIVDFTVGVPLSASVGQNSLFTAQATANTGEVATSTTSVVVSGAPSAGNRPPVKVDAVEVDGFELSTSETNIRDLERGKDFALKVKLSANAAASNVEIRAFVSGFEFSSTEPISDASSPFDVQAGVSYVKSLTLRLPDRTDIDRYRIRVVISGRDTDDITTNYRIQVSPTAHEVVIKDLSVSPEDVQPGRAVLATVRIKNLGQKTENDVAIRVSIPELGVTAAPDFVDKLQSDESATSQDFFLRIDPCAKPGTYDVRADVTFEQGDKVVSASKTIIVSQGGSCQSRPVSVGGDVSISGSEPQTVQSGTAASFPVTITNRRTATKVYSLSVAGTEWAGIRFSPSSMVTVRPGDTQIVNVVILPNRNAREGANTFTILVKDQAGEIVKSLSFSANIVVREEPKAVNVVQLLQWGLIVLIVLLVIVALVVAFRRVQGPKEGEEGTQTYY